MTRRYTAPRQSIFMYMRNKQRSYVTTNVIIYYYYFLLSNNNVFCDENTTYKNNDGVIP